MADVIRQFYKAVGAWPRRAVIYRCGAYAGENPRATLQFEPQAIKEAIARVTDQDVQLTYMTVCNDRLRIAPTSESGVDNAKSSNCPPGLVVDTGVVHPLAQDFYVNTYAGIQGTNNLLYVRVLLNECKCPGDIIKSMTVALAYMYSSLRVPDARRTARPTFGVAGTPRLTAP